MMPGRGQQPMGVYASHPPGLRVFVVLSHVDDVCRCHRLTYEYITFRFSKKVPEPSEDPKTHPNARTHTQHSRRENQGHTHIYTAHDAEDTPDILRKAAVCVRN